MSLLEEGERERGRERERGGGRERPPLAPVLMRFNRREVMLLRPNVPRPALHFKKRNQGTWPSSHVVLKSGESEETLSNQGLLSQCGHLFGGRDKVAVAPTTRATRLRRARGCRSPPIQRETPARSGTRGNGLLPRGGHAGTSGCRGLVRLI